MSKSKEKPCEKVIEAAGGLIWRTTPAGREIAIIHRPRYDDWTLPKGKRDPGETWQETAQREILEETGYPVDFTGFAGATAYTVEGVPKVVLFWHVELRDAGEFRPNNEVDALAWLSVGAALEKLSYKTERRLLKKWAK